MEARREGGRLNGSDLLLTTAEIGIAIAGFAGLASVVGRGRRGYNPEADSLRLRTMLEVSLLVVAFSLLPAFLSVFLGSENPVRPSTLTFGASFVAYNVYIAVRYFRSDLRAMDPIWYMLFWGLLTVPASLVLLYAGIRLSTESCSAIYFASLYYLLVLSGIQFLRLIVSILRGSI